MLTTGFSRIILLTTSSFKDTRAYDRNPWLEPLTLPAGAPWIFLIFFDFFRKTKKIKKICNFFDFFRKGQKTKKIKKMKKILDPGSPRVGGFWPKKMKKNQKNEKNPGLLGLPAWGVSGRRNPSLTDPERLLAGALDSPCGGTLDFFDFLDFVDFFRKTKKMKKIKKNF